MQEILQIGHSEIELQELKVEHLKLPNGYPSEVVNVRKV